MPFINLDYLKRVLMIKLNTSLMRVEVQLSDPCMEATEAR